MESRTPGFTCDDQYWFSRCNADSITNAWGYIKSSCLPHLIEADYVGMLEQLHKLDLLVELVPGLGIQVALVDNLDSDFLACERMLGESYNAEVPATDCL